VTVAAPDLWFPNGMALLGTTLVVAETFGMRLTAFDVEPDGSLSGRRQWAALAVCAPDGICGDAEGAVWVANARASECLRVAEGGKVLARVATSQPCFACALGGPDRRTLFCCTAPTSQADQVRHRAAGRIERAQVIVPGGGLP
jgi:sugar lactone lactonase YvrE